MKPDCTNGAVATTTTTIITTNNNNNTDLDLYIGTGSEI